MPNSEGKKRPPGQDKTTQKRKRKPEYARVNAAGVESMKGTKSTQEERYRILVQNLPCAVYSAYPGKAGPTTFMSNKWKDWTGYSPEELYHNPEAWPRCIHRDDREYAMNTYIEACRDRMAYNLEYRVVHKDTGQIRYVRDQGHLSKDEKGAVVRVDGIVTDITELKKTHNELDKYRDSLEELVKKRTSELTSAYETLKVENKKRQRTEQALQESEERFRAIYENALVGLYRTTYDGQILMANPALVQMLGYSSFEELAQRNLEEEGFSRDYQRSVFKQRVEAEDRIVGLESRWMRRDGTTLFVRESARTVRDKDGEILYYEGTVADLTERKKAEEALRKAHEELEERVRERTAELEQANKSLQTEIAEHKQAEEQLAVFRKFAEASEQALGMADLEGFITYANPILCRVLGAQRPQDICGTNVADYYLKQDLPTLQDEILPAVFEQGHQTIEIPLSSVDGKVTEVIQSIFLIRDDQGKPFRLANVITDITERKRTEEELRRHRDHLEEMIATRTHELERSNETLHAEIAERKQAEEALRESENSYRAVVENAAEGIVVVQGQTLQFVNPALVSMIGYSKEELLTRPFIEFVHPDHRDWTMGIHIKRFKGEEVPPIYELKVLDKKGNIIWVENNGILIEWRDKPATLNFLRDVTERKKAEQAIWASESEKRSILNAISDHIIFHDTDLTIRWCNEAAARSVGMTHRELVGCHCYELWQGRSEPCEGCPVLRAIETGSYNAGIITTPDGKWWEIIGEPVLDRDGQIRGAIEISRDITERKKTEQALRESEERLKILFESAPDTIYLIDSEGKFIDGNRAAEELIGFTKDEIIGKNLAEMGLLSDGQLSKAKANLKKAATSKLSGPNEYTLKRKNGSHISIEVRTFPVKIGGKMLSLGIARDITEHKRTEKELLEHQAKLKSLASQLSLTEELERHRLATNLHDQISQSLVISKIKLDQLRKSSTSDEFNKPLEGVSNCLGQIIDDTRTLTFDLSYPILYELGFEAAVAEWLTDQIQEKHGIRTEFLDDGHQKPLDDDIRVLLFRNVRELLINVVKHAQANKVRVSIRKVKDNIRVSVEDDGIGFDPVEVTSMAAKRAEFGLFSIRERLEQLGGLIEIDSKRRRGSKITMIAPLKNGDEADRE